MSPGPFALALATLACLSPDIARADEWWGRDKALHFGLSVALGAGGYAVAAPFTERRTYRLVVGAGSSLALGGAKEGYDALGYGDPSWKDFAWDVAGTTVGTLVAYAVDKLFFDDRKPQVTVTSNAIAFRF